MRLVAGQDFQEGMIFSLGELEILFL